MANSFNNSRLNTDYLIKLIPIYVKELIKDHKLARTFLETNNAKALSEVLHKMKGSALSFGVNELADLIKNRANNNNFESELAELVTKIESDAIRFYDKH